MTTPEWRYDWPEGEALPILQCLCGRRFERWDFFLYSDEPMTMPCCGRRAMFVQTIKIIETK